MALLSHRIQLLIGARCNYILHASIYFIEKKLSRAEKIVKFFGINFRE